MRIREIENPTPEQIEADMLRRLRQSIEAELSSLSSIIATNRNYPNSPVCRTRIKNYSRYRDNVETLQAQLALGRISVRITIAD